MSIRDGQRKYFLQETKKRPRKVAHYPPTVGGSLADRNKLRPDNLGMRVPADDLLPPLLHPLGIPEEPEEPLRYDVLHIKQAIPAAYSSLEKVLAGEASGEVKPGIVVIDAPDCARLSFDIDDAVPRGRPEGVDRLLRLPE